MDKKNRRFEIQSKVRVPDMEDIQKAASNFNEVTDEQNHDFVARNAKHFIATNDSDKFEKHLSNMKKEMEQLAMAVASEDKAKTESDMTGSTDAAESSEPAAEPVVVIIDQTKAKKSAEAESKTADSDADR